MCHQVLSGKSLVTVRKTGSLRSIPENDSILYVGGKRRTLIHIYQMRKNSTSTCDWWKDSLWSQIKS